MLIKVKSAIIALMYVTNVTIAVAAESLSNDDKIIDSNGIVITISDIEADVAKAPPEARRYFLSKPENISRQAGNLYVRRYLANKAIQEKLDQNPITISTIQLAKDKILSDIALMRFDSEVKIEPEKLEKFALVQYKANIELFSTAEEVRASHILLDKKNLEAREKGAELINSLVNGANFEELAKTHSIDPGSASQGGDLGYFKRDKMIKTFSDAAFALKINEISPLIETDFGFHIIKLIDRKEKVVKSFDEVKPSLISQVKANLITDERIKLEKGIIEKVKINNDYINKYSNQFK